MSAFVVSKAHIDVLVGAAMPGKGGSREGLYWYHENNGRRSEIADADQLGQMLWDECVSSVSYRYPKDDRERDLPGKYLVNPDGSKPDFLTEGERKGEWTVPYTWPFFGHLPEPVAILKAISCYEYQSCEHPGWEASEAKTFCDALRDHVITQLPGYEEARWEVA